MKLRIVAIFGLSSDFHTPVFTSVYVLVIGSACPLMHCLSISGTADSFAPSLPASGMFSIGMGFNIGILFFHLFVFFGNKVYIVCCYLSFVAG